MITEKNKNLINREADILSRVVDCYIETCKPISSKFVKVFHGLNISTATIRKTMASLEEKGYLTHFHTSGGRIPTDSGYRYYVNTINFPKKIDKDITNALKDELKTVNNNVDKLLSITTVMLSNISQMFSVVTISDYQSCILTDIELVPIQGNRIMLVLAMDTGLVKSIVLSLQISIDDKSIKKTAELLKEKLVGCSLKEIQSTIIGRLNDVEMYGHELIQILVNERYKYFNITSNNNIYTSPVNVLLNYPEFQNITKFQKILPALDKSFLSDYFNQNFSHELDEILIGEENADKILSECSIVSSPFNQGTVRGRIGVIGPKRIPYVQIQNILNNFTEIINSAG